MTERFQLDRFLEVFPGVPAGQIEKTTHPDFVISNNTLSIGMELTQLYKIDRHGNFQPREIEAFREKIVSLAKEIYGSRNSIPLEVGVLFSETALTDAENTAKRLAVVIENLASGSEPWRVVTHDEIDMPKEFIIIRIIKRPLHTNCPWTVSYSGWLPDLDKSAIQTAISKKNMKIEKYRNQTSEIWLLLVMDQIYLSSSFKVPDTVISNTYDSMFNKTILFSCIDKKYWILNTKAPDNPIQVG